MVEHCATDTKVWVRVLYTLRYNINIHISMYIYINIKTICSIDKSNKK